MSGLGGNKKDVISSIIKLLFKKSPPFRWSNQINTRNAKLFSAPIIMHNDLLGNALKWLTFGNLSRPKGLLRSGQPNDEERNYSQSAGTGDGRNEQTKQIPRLLYIQNPLVWMSNKLDFRYLRSTWDPAFSEQEFTRGARQAVSTITQLLSENMFESLKPLLTKNAMISLRRDVEILWAEEVRRHIALLPEDLQLIIPRKLHFRRLTDKKFCDIDMVFIGLKYLDSRNFNPPLVFVDIIARFHRNYTDGISPDWTISAFKVRRFNVIPPKFNN